METARKFKILIRQRHKAVPYNEIRYVTEKQMAWYDRKKVNYEIIN